jgi:hypothetical protein
MAANLTLEDPPFKNALTSSKADPTMSGPWQTWFSIALLPRVQTAAPSLVTETLTAQAASIGTTVLIPLASGFYRVNWYARITTPATSSSSLTVGFTSTDNTVPVTQTGAALTGNLTSTTGSGVFLMNCDASTPLTYTTTYASVGATAMEFSLTLVVEGLV